VPSTDVVKFGDAFALATVDVPAVAEAVRVNLAGADVSAALLDRIKVPSGGGLAWEVPTLDGVDPRKTIQCVILRHQNVRAYWRESLDDTGGGQPPDCHSPDNRLGYGDPGDSLRSEGKGCADCPYSQFGSADGGDGRGQACKQMDQLFVVLADETLPMALSLPPTSLKSAQQFQFRLGGKGKMLHHVITEIGLEKVQGNGVPDYARATFRVAGVLSPEEAGRVEQYSAALADVFERDAAAAAAGGDAARPAAAAQRDEDPPAPAGGDDLPIDEE
jgi:hypothetical protein